MCALGSEADICEAGWVGGVHVSTLGSGEDYCEADWVGGVQVCPLGSGKDICEGDWMGRVHLCTLGSGGDNCEAAGWARCMCVPWALDQRILRLLGGRGGCVCSGV